MHVTFVSLGAELLGTEYLSAYLKAGGHRTSLAHNPALFNDRFQVHIPSLAKIFKQDDRIVEYILYLDPDLIAFPCLTNIFEWCIDIARRVRERKRIKTVFGGVHPSAVPEFVMGYDEVDFVCQSEGEVPLLNLADDLESGGDGADIANIWTKTGGTIVAPPRIDPFMQDLDSLPFPDKDLYAAAVPKRFVYNAMTARGCPYRCTFCFNNFFANLPTADAPKKYVRRRSVDNVLEELVRGKEKYDYVSIAFHDDIFTMNEDWLREFLPRLKKEVGVPFGCETHAKFMNYTVAKLLKDNGCVGTKMGIQSLGEFKYKYDVLKRAEKKEDLINALDACRRVGLQLDADHIFGLPDESDSDLQNALDFYRNHTPSRISCFWLTYFPGIEITEKAYARGEISDDEMTDIKRGRLLWYHQVQALTKEGRQNINRNVPYMIAFHIMPSVPRRLRKYVSPNVLGRIPFMCTISRLVMAVRMLTDWLFDGNFGAVMYLRQYMHFILGNGRHINKIPKRKRRSQPRVTHPEPVSASTPGSR